ncbi:Hypothetical protein D9617_3g022280 [Elsinoe fawcettii]|nr:Hypothetical protein D9617_3g022280 [Elsinoe fawcettii]
MPDNTSQILYSDDENDDTFHCTAEHEDTSSKAKQVLKDFRDDAKHKSKRLLHALNPKQASGETSEVDQDDPAQELLNNTAFDPSQLVAEQKRAVGGKSDKILGTALAAGKAIANPKSAFKRKAVSSVAVKDRPYLSQQADADYVDAHVDLDNAQASSQATSDEDDNTHVDATKSRLEQLEDARDARKVAWTTSRHVMRVAVVANQSPPPPDPEDFYITNEQTGKRKVDWESYFYASNRYRAKSFAIERMGEVDVRPQEPFDKDVCVRYIERILIATSPWQSWALSIRSLWRWEDPRKTARWAAIWFLIWYFDYVMTFVLSWMAFIVLENRFYRKRAQALQDSNQRSQDDSRNAFRLNELINRHGPGEWFDPLIEKAGPLAQMQLSDLADFLEILANFYDWKDPFRTWSTLFWYACAILVGVLTPTGFSWKILTMFTLLAFFVSRPIASRHPQYRHVVNALKWIFWDIPTDAEWSFMYLRRKAQETRERIIEQQVQKDYNEGLNTINQTISSDHSAMPPTIHISDADPASDTDAGYHTPPSRTSSTDSLQHLLPEQPLQSFSTRYKGLKCRLLILPSGLTLRQPSLSKTLHHIPWPSLREIRKSSSSTLAKIASMEGIDLVISPSSSDTHDPRRRRSTHDTIDAHLMNDAHLQILRLSTLHNRDRAFNLIIGFSVLKFQALPPVKAGKERARERNRDVADGREGEDVGVTEKLKGRTREVGTKVKGVLRGGENQGVEGRREYDAYQAFREGGWGAGWFA